MVGSPLRPWQPLAMGFLFRGRVARALPIRTVMAVSVTAVVLLFVIGGDLEKNARVWRVSDVSAPAESVGDSAVTEAVSGADVALEALQFSGNGGSGIDNGSGRNGVDGGGDGSGIAAAGQAPPLRSDLTADTAVEDTAGTSADAPTSAGATADGTVDSASAVTADSSSGVDVTTGVELAPFDGPSDSWQGGDRQGLLQLLGRIDGTASSSPPPSSGWFQYTRCWSDDVVVQRECEPLVVGEGLPRRKRVQELVLGASFPRSGSTWLYRMMEQVR